MIKIKLFNSQRPIDINDLELTAEQIKNEGCLIGSSSNCGIVLPSINVSEIQGKIFTTKEDYYFKDLTNTGKSQFNDEVVEANQDYPLDIDDIIRIGEFVLIIEEVPTNGKPQQRKQKVKPKKSINANSTDTQKGTRKSLQNLKSLLKKNRSDNPDNQGILESNSTPIVQSGNKTENLSQNPETSFTEKSVLPLPPVSTPPPLPTSSIPVANSLEKLPSLEGINWWKKGELTVSCVEIIDETEDVKTFRFTANPAVLFTYKPGQFVTLNLDINGKSVKRSYSISSTPSRPHILEITVKRVAPPPDKPDVPSGLVSNWLHDEIKVGSKLKISSPLGKFTCTDNPQQKLLFISAGSGITPMMSMSRFLLDTVADKDILFFHSARSSHDLIFRQELELMSAKHSNFRLAFTITRVNKDETWSGFTGRLSEELLQKIVPNFRERTVYVCGPNSFMEGAKNLLLNLGFPMENYFEESFGGSKKQSSDNSSSLSSVPSLTPSSLVFTKSKQEINCDGKNSILEVAEAEAIIIDSSCRSGSCGSCKVRKLEGEIHYQSEPNGLDLGEKEAGYILTCIAYPVGKVVLEA